MKGITSRQYSRKVSFQIPISRGFPSAPPIETKSRGDFIYPYYRLIAYNIHLPWETTFTSR